MNAFRLTNFTNGIRVVSQEVKTPAQNWDEISAEVESTLSLDALRAAYPSGLRLNLGLGFFLQEPEFAPAGGGLTKATLRLQGLFARKTWSHPGVALAVRSVENINVKLNGVIQNFTKASYMDATPVFKVRIMDGTAPAYEQVGQAASSPPIGTVWPTPAGAGPWSAYGGYVMTRNIPSGWVLTDLQGDPISSADAGPLGSSQTLWDKEYTYTLFWPWVP